MRTSHKCIKCFFRQGERAASSIKLSIAKKVKLKKFLTQRLRQFDFNNPPVVFGRTIYKAVARIGGVKDIFHKEKQEIENRLIKFAGSFKITLQQSKQRLYMAAKASCAANAIDFGAGKTPDLRRLLRRIKRVRLKVDHFSIFCDKVATAKTVLIIGDNCGEVLFDKFFIIELLRVKPKIKVFYAARSAPVINDILRQDAIRVGIDKVAKVISSGCDYPGLMLSKTSSYFKKIYREADFVISKGQGNFESLNDKRKNIFYLFQIKCRPVSDFLCLSAGSLLFLHNKTQIGEIK